MSLSPKARSTAIVGAAFALVFLAGAAAWWHLVNAKRAGKNEVDVVRLSNTLSDGALIGDQLGVFARHGIKIQWTGKLAHGPAAIVALAGGQNDFAGSISTAILIARTHGADLKIVAAYSQSRKEHPAYRYLVKDGSPITGKPQDFIGKKVVATPTTIGWYPLVVWLKRGGVDLSQVEFVQLPSPTATEQAFREGKVDVLNGSEFTPPVSKLVKEGGVHFLPGLSDVEVLQVDQTSGWAVRQELIRKNPDLVRRFVAALGESYAWADAHPDSAQAILNERNGVPVPYRIYQTSWKASRHTVPVDSVSIRKWIGILEDFGQIPKGSVKPEDAYTNEFSAQVR